MNVSWFEVTAHQSFDMITAETALGGAFQRQERYIDNVPLCDPDTAPFRLDAILIQGGEEFRAEIHVGTQAHAARLWHHLRERGEAIEILYERTNTLIKVWGRTWDAGRYGPWERLDFTNPEVRGDPISSADLHGPCLDLVAGGEWPPGYPEGPPYFPEDHVVEAQRRYRESKRRMG